MTERAFSPYGRTRNMAISLNQLVSALKRLSLNFHKVIMAVRVYFGRKKEFRPSWRAVTAITYGHNLWLKEELTAVRDYYGHK